MCLLRQNQPYCDYLSPPFGRPLPITSLIMCITGRRNTFFNSLSINNLVVHCSFIARFKRGIRKMLKIIHPYFCFYHNFELIFGKKVKFFEITPFYHFRRFAPEILQSNLPLSVRNTAIDFPSRFEI